MITRACAALLVALSICGCATTNTPHVANTAGAPAGSSCIMSTGSLMPGGETNCITGRSYSRTDLDRTGRTTVAAGLRNLDPSLTISH